MGGFSEAIGKIAAEGLEDVGSKITSKIAEVAPEISLRGLFSPERAFEQANPYAKELYHDHVTEYVPKKSEYESKIANGLKNPINAHPSVRGAISTLDPTGKLGPANKVPVSEISKHASKMASDEVYGPNRIAIQDMLRYTINNQGQQTADILSDHYNVMFQEAAPKYGGKSQFGKDMAGAGGDDEKGIQTPLSPYKIKGKWEKFVQPFRQALAYKAAVIHAGVAGGNLTSEYGYTNMLKAVNQLYGPEHQIDNLLASNAISELTIAPLREKQAFENGVIHKFAPGGVGEFIHQNFLIPGLAPVRRQSIAMGAQGGKLVAEEAAYRLSKGDSQYAIQALKRLNIDPAKVIDQGYKLHPEDINKAYYHGANNTVFLNPYDKTPTFWRQSPLFRSMKAYSGYITQQGAFMRGLLLHQMRSGDTLGLARTIANWGLMAPLVAATIVEFDRITVGEDHEGGIAGMAKHLENRYKATPAGRIASALTGSKAASNPDSVYNTIYLLGTLGAWGNITGYIRGANRSSLVGRFMPPEARMAEQGLEDVVKASGRDSKHPKAAEPLGRDLLSDIPSYGLGTQASHIIFPTEKEAAKNKSHRPRRTQAKPKNWNPRQFNPDADF